MADTTSSSAPAAKNRSVQGGVLSATGSGAPSIGRERDSRLERVGAAAQDDAVLGEGRRRRLHDLVERPPSERDLLEAEAHVHVVAGVDGVVLAAGLDVRDALQQEQLVAVQRGGCAGDAEDARAASCRCNRVVQASCCRTSRRRRPSSSAAAPAPAGSRWRRCRPRAAGRARRRRPARAATSRAPDGPGRRRTAGAGGRRAQPHGPASCRDCAPAAASADEAAKDTVRCPIGQHLSAPLAPQALDVPRRRPAHRLGAVVEHDVPPPAAVHPVEPEPPDAAARSRRPCPRPAG